MTESIALDKILAAVFVGIGAIVMLYSLLRYRNLVSNENNCRSASSGIMRILHGSHLLLMGFFIVGYLIIFLSFVTGVEVVSELFVSLIFLFGAIFVLFGVIIQSKMLSCLQTAHTDSIKMLVSAVEIRDPYTIGHSEHVANLLTLLNQYQPEHVRVEHSRLTLEQTGLLHDIGKIGVPEPVLNKTTRLTEDEWQMIREHASIGATLIGELDEFKEIKDWIRYHHERVDGKGYYGSPEPSIPYVSKMLAVVDTYSALVTDRPYRKGKLHTEAISILRENRGTQLDTALVDIFSKIPGEEIEKCRPTALIRNYIDEIRKVESHLEQSDHSKGIDIVLSQHAGTICLSKLLDYAAGERLNLSFATLRISQLMEIEKEFGYHTADEIAESFGQLLLNNVRDTDIVVGIERNTFVLAFSSCPLNQAMKLVHRIHQSSEMVQIFDKPGFTPTIEKTYVEFDPAVEATLHQAIAFIEELQKPPGAR